MASSSTLSPNFLLLLPCSCRHGASSLKRLQTLAPTISSGRLSSVLLNHEEAETSTTTIATVHSSDPSNHPSPPPPPPPPPPQKTRLDRPIPLRRIPGMGPARPRRRTGPLRFTGAVGPHLVSLKHLEGDGGVAYCVHGERPDGAGARSAVLDFLNADIRLGEIWEVFSASDSRFAELARLLRGARVLRQDPLECLIQFLCSSNNNIARITKMVDFVSSLGRHLGTVEGLEFYEFPSLERLLAVSEKEFRDAGFGYRAKYIVGTVKTLQSKPGGGVEWLTSLRGLDLQDAITSLCTLSGVGSKVAACVALFSLDQHHAIPVDTHVWQIATRYLLPELAGARLTPKLSGQVAEAFVSKYGKYAGWAQTMLFIAELPSQKAIIPSHCLTIQEDEKVERIDKEASVAE
ncbi:hypothetical protein NL676_027770 [Syzygium grande]|nr:hypothetical protein NL676_027770 [Syzygium grande]